MPLTHGASRRDFSKNIATEIDANKPRAQAAAIAYSVAGKSKAAHQHTRECREAGACEFKQAVESLRAGGMA